MSRKYVIDIPDDAQYITINAMTENSAYSIVKTVDKLEKIPAGVRLIDANKMRRSVKFTGGTGDLFKEWIDRQPTVIETEADQ